MSFVFWILVGPTQYPYRTQWDIWKYTGHKPWPNGGILLNGNNVRCRTESYLVSVVGWLTFCLPELHPLLNAFTFIILWLSAVRLWCARFCFIYSVCDWDFWICELMTFIKYGIFLVIFWYIFTAIFSLFCFCNYSYMYGEMFDISHDVLSLIESFLIHFYFYFLNVAVYNLFWNTSNGFFHLKYVILEFFFDLKFIFIQLIFHLNPSTL